MSDHKETISIEEFQLVTTINRDGDLDLLCPGKSGLYYFENLGR